MTFQERKETVDHMIDQGFVGADNIITDEAIEFMIDYMHDRKYIGWDYTTTDEEVERITSNEILAMISDGLIEKAGHLKWRVLSS